MNGAFYIAATGLHAQERALQAIANNITNLNTPAFKRSDVRFSELMSPATVSGDFAGGEANVMLSGVRADMSARDFSPGEVRQTGRPLDIAIGGDGFIELLGPSGTARLWRGGTLRVNDDGFLSAANGLQLKAAISVPVGATNIVIARDGVVSATLAGDSQATELGRIDLVTVKNASALTSVGDGLFTAANDADLSTMTPGEGASGEITQGALEASNVQLSDEMVTLLLMQRAFAASAQVVQAGDQLMAISNGLRR